MRVIRNVLKHQDAMSDISLRVAQVGLHCGLD
jgi:hypothetical protein